MARPLTVYKASAGSGKTFTLAVEYIKHLVSNPQSYRSILAVTFTNKATEEMKTRILSQLYGIWKRLPESDGYAQKVCDALGMAPEAVAERAGMALRLLIHNYGYFRIETIDAFFQTVLRNLARELDLTANLRIELNDSQVEEMAVDRLIEELGSDDDILKLIIRYINDNIADDKSWNVIGKIKSFGKTIFRDCYKEKSRQMNSKTGDSKFMSRYASMLRRERDEALEVMNAIGAEFMAVIQSEGLTVADFAYGSGGVAGLFVKLQNGIFDSSIVGKRVTDCLEDAGKWYASKSLYKDRIHALAESRLMPLLKRAVDERPKQWKRYRSAVVTLPHLYQLSLLRSIEEKVRALNDEANRFLLSDTQQLLYSLISDGGDSENINDSPFIFEKIGTQLEHIMIDEFQDTSSVQWRNFKVLLSECMSHERASNLIVGDVKQSIYRWRSGDWRLLNNIGAEFDNAGGRLDIVPLKTNYRSAGNIICFNNAFFRKAVAMECDTLEAKGNKQADMLRAAYSDVAQDVLEKNSGKGYVSVKILAGKSSDTAGDRMLDELTACVRRITGTGARPGSIAILVRSNKNIPLIATHLTDNLPEVQIVSDEAFRLDASLTVRTLVQALHLLTHRDDLLTAVSLVKTHRMYVMGIPFDETEAGNDVMAMLPDEYSGCMDELALMPLYDLTERLYAIFGLSAISGQDAYVCAFYDKLSAFTQDHIADIDSFVDEWERHLCECTIQSEQPDGIRIISIHKSKGLEFDNVIIPYCDWQLEMFQNNLLWCSPKEEPYNALDIVPVNYSGCGMKETIYEDDYMDEHLQNCVDNLNLLYVAFTRAVKNLFVIGQYSKKPTRLRIIHDCLEDVAAELDATVTGEDAATDDIVFEYGMLEADNSTGHKPDAVISANVFVQPVTPVRTGIGIFANKTEFMQSNSSRDFIAGDDADNRNEYIRTGNVLHKVFSEIRTAADIDKAMTRLETEGLLDSKDAERIAVMLRKRLATPQVAEWFADGWQLYNECSILVPGDDGEFVERRPDRVMYDGRRMVVVDFKFGTPKDSYRTQVREYMQLLTAMGHKNVEGYLWFVYSNKIEKV